MTLGSAGLALLLSLYMAYTTGRKHILNNRIALAETENSKAQSILACIGEGLLAIDNAGNIITLNKYAAQMLGCNIPAAIGKKVAAFWSLEDTKGQPVSLEQQMRNGSSLLAAPRTTTVNCYCVLRDKSTLPLALTVSPLIYENGIHGSVVTFRDRTKESESDRIKSEFVSFASHQLRFPLGIMKWYLEAARKEERLEKIPEHVLFYLTKAYQSNERLIAVVNNLLSASRIDQGKVNNRPAPVDIIEVVPTIIEEIGLALTKKDVALKFVVKQSPIPKVQVDPLQLQEVLENLIVNGLQYTPAGTVSVIVEKTESSVLIRIKDTGIGISLKDQKQLFTKFFRCAEATAVNNSGSGLGLYIAKSYIEGWGGSITVESSPNKGSTFSVSLPLAPKR